MNRAQLVVRLYRTGLTLSEVAAHINGSKTTVLKLLKESNFDRRRPKRIYELNESYFEYIDSTTKAYWLGFLLADGTATKYGLSITLQAKDIHHLRQLAKDIEYTGPIKETIALNQRTGKRHPAARITVWSKKLVEPLLQAGWEKFKRHGKTSILESVSSSLTPALLRGIFDGDGCITTDRKNGVHFTIIDAHHDSVRWYRDQLIQSLHLTKIKVSKRKRPEAHTIHYSGRNQVSKIMCYLYSTSGPKLNRKWNKYQNLFVEGTAPGE